VVENERADDGADGFERALNPLDEEPRLLEPLPVDGEMRGAEPPLEYDRPLPDE